MRCGTDSRESPASLAGNLKVLRRIDSPTAACRRRRRDHFKHATRSRPCRQRVSSGVTMAAWRSNLVHTRATSLASNWIHLQPQQPPPLPLPPHADGDGKSMAYLWQVRIRDGAVALIDEAVEWTHKRRTGVHICSGYITHRAQCVREGREVNAFGRGEIRR